MNQVIDTESIFATMIGQNIGRAGCSATGGAKIWHTGFNG